MSLEILLHSPVYSKELVRVTKLARLQPEREHRLVNSLDLLLAILVQKQWRAAQLLESMHVTAELVQSALNETQSDPAPVQTENMVKKLLTLFSSASPYGTHVRKALQNAWERCFQLRKRKIEIEDLIWGIMEANDPVLHQALRRLDLEPVDLQRVFATTPS